jgi:hypothetical protein
VPVWERTKVQAPQAERLFRQTLIKRLTRRPNDLLHPQLPLGTPPLHAVRHLWPKPLIEPEPNAVQFLGWE